MPYVTDFVLFSDALKGIQMAGIGDDLDDFHRSRNLWC
jgi:hypothetical protein